MMGGRGRRLAILVAAGVGVCVSGCGSSSPSGATRAAEAFYAAVGRHDGGAACRLLSPAAASSVASSGGGDCASAVIDLDLPGGTPLRTEGWQTAARVVLTRDTAFLSRFPAGWRVTAAGCTRSGGRYDCDVTG